LALAEILDVAHDPVDSQRLWGRFIDLPKPGTLSEVRAVDIGGWALGRKSPVVAVEVVRRGSTIRRIPVGIRRPAALPRPDLVAAYPQARKAEWAGFRATISLLRPESEVELVIRAVLRNRKRLPIGTIKARRRWRESANQKDGPLVSIIIPCYRQAHFLSEAIESALAQTYRHFEILVIDDGSPDNTSEVAARYPGVRHIRQENQGLAASRNRGIRSSNGDFLVFLDADDRLLPNAVATGLDALHTHPECALVWGRCEVIASDGSPLPASQPKAKRDDDHYGELLTSNFIWAPATVMYRRSLFEFVEGFDPSISPSADYDLYLRVMRDHAVHCHNELVAQYRRHAANMTRNAEVMLSATCEVLRLQRKYVRRNGRYREAYKAGLRTLRAEYGEPLVDQIRACIQDRQWKAAMKGLAAILRYYPRGLRTLILTVIPGLH
jgi:glycosyltransferase involved in cell wall biosynthesis